MSIRIHWARSLLLNLLLVSSMTVMAADVVNSQEQSTTVENSVAQTTVDSVAKDWGLTDAEWARYQQLMSGPDGLWYRQLTPPAVLGMRAEDPAEQKHFAELYAQQEHAKVARELAFNQAVFVALRQLYPDEPMIKPFDMTPFSPAARSEREDDKPHGAIHPVDRTPTH